MSLAILIRLGEMRVPAGAYYGAQTARAVENFPISNLRFPRQFIRAVGLIKQHAAKANAALGLLPSNIADAVQTAAQEIVEGKLDAHFVVDVFQTGSGTSTNMNANEVIANRAMEFLGCGKGDKLVHPNDHVNCGQSSNDVIPSAIHIAALEGIVFQLRPALSELHESLRTKAQQFGGIIKIGRTHLQDATPIRLGQEFSGYASQIEHGLARLKNVEPHLGELALGGTAVGTGINTHPDFAQLVIEGVSRETGLNLRKAPNHFEAQAARDACVEASGALKVVAVSRLTNLRQDISFRLDTSGDKFVIELDGQETNNRGIAGELILRRAEKLKNRFGDDVRIGRFAGFDLFLRPSFNNTVDVVVRGKNSYAARVTDTALGTIRSLEATVQGFEERAVKLDADIADAHKRIKELETKVGTPFEKEEHYQSLCRRQSEIEEQLDLTKNQAPSQVEAESPDGNTQGKSETQNVTETVRMKRRAGVTV